MSVVVDHASGVCVLLHKVFRNSIGRTHDLSDAVVPSDSCTESAEHFYVMLLWMLPASTAEWPFAFSLGSISSIASQLRVAS